MSRAQNTKQGVAAIYVVVFTTMLIGIITLSFLRIMLSESGRTLNDTLSDSAYNAALAGVEDAKFIVAQYQKEIAAGQDEHTSDLVDEIENNSENNCDIIPESLNLLPGLSGHENGEQNIGSNESFQDQAYTCVTISLRGDFKGTLSANNPTLVVPLRPSGDTGETVNDVAKVKLVWYMNKKDESGSTVSFNGTELQGLADSGINGTVNNDGAISDRVKNSILGQRGVKSEKLPTELNGMRVMLVQSPDGATNPEYYSSDGENTNRGTLMLLASTDGVTEIEKNAFAQSADKNLNAPLSIKCSSGVCTAIINLPKPRGGDSRDKNNFFLVLNQLYSEPAITVTATMQNNSGKDIDFFDVQPIVDATGRSGDLFRRVEARIGTDNGASLVPTAELSTNGDINKSFYVTKNCIQGTEECVVKPE